MITCIAIDDEPLALELITNHCSRLDWIDLKKTFTRTSDAAKYLEKFPVDLLFLDIRMPDITGTEFYRSLKEQYQVIFTTAYSEYAVEGFDLDAVDYLLKPVRFERFLKAVEKSRETLSRIRQKDADSERFINVRCDYNLIRLRLEDILFIEGLDNYIKIFTAGGKTITCHSTMKAMLERLPRDQFIRVHRSYIVSLGRQPVYRNRYLSIDGRRIPVGVSYNEKIRKLFGEKSS
jgi:DNA-binding LytR/AlgR family response regulator